MVKVISRTESRSVVSDVGISVPDAVGAGLEIRLFGPMEVLIGGNPLPRLRSRKGLWLLALLALRAGRDVERDWLAGTLWPDCRDTDARRSLRQSLHDLRAALGPEADRLACESPRTLRLDLSANAWIDVLAFDTATAKRHPEALETAVRLYRGPLLEDCAEEWVLDERRRREQQYLSALETLASTAMACQEYTAATNYLRLAVGIDPLREDLQRALMESLSADGNAAAALLVFRDFRSHLWQEMATEPDSETAALYRRLREEARQRARTTAERPATPEAPVTPSSPLAVLPQQRTALIGREDDADEVIASLGRARLVTLTGTGGIGKTRLSLRVAESQADEYEGGAPFVALAPLSDPAGVPEAVRQALGVPPLEDSARQSPTESLCRYLSSRRLLLVLDNCEHVLDACASLADALLTTCPGVRILATSRQALGLRGEAVWRVPSLAVPSVTDKDFADYAAVRLFVARACEADSSFQLTPRNAPALIRVCGRLDGIPLAIELAAARVRALTVEEIDDRLDNQFRLLTGGDRTALPRQQTLRGALDWSWNLLTEPEKVLLSRLSVFAGGWTLEAAEQVCSGSVVEDWEVLDLLTALMDKSLLLAEKNDNGTTRYRLLETVRQYGRDRMKEQGESEEESVRTRHQKFFAELGTMATSLDDYQRIERLQADHDNLRAALDWQGPSGEKSQETALRTLELTGNLSSFWLATGHLHEGEERLRAVLAFDGDNNDEAYRKARMRALRGLVAIVRELGDYPTAHTLYEELLALHRQAEDKFNIAATISEMGVLARLQSNFRCAQSLLEEGLEMFREMQNQRCIAISLATLGVVMGDMGDLAHARTLLEEAVQIQREHGNPGGVASALNNLGVVVRDQGHFAEARKLMEEALALHRELKNQRSIGSALINLGGVVGDMGDYPLARLLLEEALTMYRDNGTKKGTATTLTALGALAHSEGDDIRARSLLLESLVLHRELGDTKHFATTLQCLASVVAAQGLRSQSLQLWGAAEAMRDTMGTPLNPGDQLEQERQSCRVRAVLGDAASDAAWAEGRAMSLDEAYRKAMCLPPVMA